MFTNGVMKNSKELQESDLAFMNSFNFWMDKRNYTQDQFAKILGVSRQSVSQYCKGDRTPPFSGLWRIVKSLGLTVEEFLACEENTGPDIVFVERVSARPSAGGGSLETDAKHKGLYSFHKSFIQRKGGRPDEMKIFEVSGDSMAPTLDDCDLIMVNTQDTAIRTGYIYLLRIDDELLVKRLETRPGMTVVRSDNPDYQPIEIAKNDESIDWEVFGRMVWSCREY